MYLEMWELGFLIVSIWILDLKVSRGEAKMVPQNVIKVQSNPMLVLRDVTMEPSNASKK